MIVALVVAGIVAVGIIVIGCRYLLAPEATAQTFGVRTDPARAFLSVKGVRDIGYGLVPLVLMIAGQWTALGWFLVAAAFVPIGDAVIVLRHGGSRATALGVHAATAAVMLAAGLYLVLAR